MVGPNHYGPLALLVTAGASGAISAILTALVFRACRRSFACELREMERLWLELERAVASIPPDTSESVVSVGLPVVVREVAEVTNNSLWDANNTQYCQRAGVVLSVDDDGDVNVRLDDTGEEIVCDVKFLIPAATSDLHTIMSDMRSAMRALTAVMRPGRVPVSFE